MTRRVYPETPRTDLTNEQIALHARLLDAHIDTVGRLSRLEGTSEHFATKADVANAKVWALTSIGGAGLSILSLAVAVVLFPVRALG